MTPKYYHSPLKPVSTRVRCPVCHQEVYSRAGIHPQCAVKQADPPRPKPRPPVKSVDGTPVVTPGVEAQGAFVVAVAAAAEPPAVAALG